MWYTQSQKIISLVISPSVDWRRSLAQLETLINYLNEKSDMY